jgi:glycerol-3-phosphate dehydrogenase (NAD(P)+)
LPTVTVLGAGTMGGAITFPLAENGHSVRLWGTWLDDEIISACRRGPHPRLGMPLPPGVKLFSSAELEEALEGADILFVAIASEGLVAVLERLLGCPAFHPGLPLFSLTKGFIPHEGRILRASACAAGLHHARFPGTPPRWASIGGPVKAVELAHGVPTASVYALGEAGLEPLLDSFRTPRYRVLAESDLIGLELCATLKNAYAILLGICDGVYRDSGTRPVDNLKALLLSRAVGELAGILEAAGGAPHTAYGPAGIGDLYVTAQSGRNRLFGERIGSGEEPAQAYNRMCSAGQLAEGYPAVRHGRSFLEGLPARPAAGRELLDALYRILFEGAACRGELQRLVSGYR